MGGPSTGTSICDVILAYLHTLRPHGKADIFLPTGLQCNVSVKINRKYLFMQCLKNGVSFFLYTYTSNSIHNITHCIWFMGSLIIHLQFLIDLKMSFKLLLNRIRVHARSR